MGGVFTISMSTLEGSVSKLRGCAIVSILVIMGLSLYVHHMTSRNLPDMALTVRTPQHAHRSRTADSRRSPRLASDTARRRAMTCACAADPPRD